MKASGLVEGNAESNTLTSSQPAKKREEFRGGGVDRRERGAARRRGGSSVGLLAMAVAAAWRFLSLVKTDCTGVV